MFQLISLRIFSEPMGRRGIHQTGLTEKHQDAPLLSMGCKDTDWVLNQGQIKPHNYKHKQTIALFYIHWTNFFILFSHVHNVLTVKVKSTRLFEQAN